MKENILFSKRMQLEDEFITWASANNVEIRPMNVIAFLLTKYEFHTKNVIEK